MVKVIGIVMRMRVELRRNTIKRWQLNKKEIDIRITEYGR